MLIIILLMVHILTVHWKDDRWIDIQLKYLQKNISQPFKVYAFLNDISPQHKDKFFYSSTEPIESHPIKLNLLAEIATLQADSPDDLLIFIDGDAFPISDVTTVACEKLKTYPLMAIQRIENANDIQPHPAFCLTTVKFWNSIKGDWKGGYRWENAQGRPTTDVGGNLLGILKENNLDWYPILRSNKRNLHPLFYGIYGDLIYHHGAGFRDKMNRADFTKFQRTLLKLIKKGPFKKKVKKFIVRNKIAESTDSSQKVFEMIRDNPSFYEYFLHSD